MAFDLETELFFIDQYLWARPSYELPSLIKQSNEVGIVLPFLLTKKQTQRD